MLFGVSADGIVVFEFFDIIVCFRNFVLFLSALT